MYSTNRTKRNEILIFNLEHYIAELFSEIGCRNLNVSL